MSNTSVRELTAGERDALAARISQLEAQARPLRELWLSVRVGSVFFGVLWLWTMLASPMPWTIITAFWLLVGGTMMTGISVWQGHETRSALRSFREVLDLNQAHIVIRVQSSRVVELLDDYLRPGYAFQLPGEEIAIFIGPELGSDRRPAFPNSDFSVIKLVDRRGRVMASSIQEAGNKLVPERQIHGGRLRRRADVEEFDEFVCVVVKGSLDDVETLFSVEGSPKS